MVKRHVCRLQHIYVSVLLRLREGLVDKAKHFRAVAVVLFVVDDDLSEHGSLCLLRNVLTHKQRLRQLCELVLLTQCGVVVEHGDTGGGVRRILLKDLRKVFSAFLRPSVVHEPVAVHHLVVGVVGVFGYHRLQHVLLLFFLSLLLVDLHLRQGYAVAVSLNGLKTVEHLYHLVVIVLRGVELEEHRYDVGVVVLQRIQLLIGFHGVADVVGVGIELSELLYVRGVLRCQLCGFRKVELRQRVVSQRYIVAGEVIVDLCRFWIYLSGMLQEVVGCRQVAGRLLVHGL